MIAMLKISWPVMSRFSVRNHFGKMFSFAKFAWKLVVDLDHIENSNYWNYSQGISTEHLDRFHVKTVFLCLLHNVNQTSFKKYKTIFLDDIFIIVNICSFSVTSPEYWLCAVFHGSWKKPTADSQQRASFSISLQNSFCANESSYFVQGRDIDCPRKKPKRMK